MLCPEFDKRGNMLVMLGKSVLSDIAISVKVSQLILTIQLQINCSMHISMCHRPSGSLTHTSMPMHCIVLHNAMQLSLSPIQTNVLLTVRS